MEVCVWLREITYSGRTRSECWPRSADDSPVSLAGYGYARLPWSRPMMQQRKPVIRIVGGVTECVDHWLPPTARVLQCKVHSSI